MTKAELISRIVNETNMKKVEVERVLSAFLGEVRNILQDQGKLTLTGFGTFRIIKRAAREGRNPQTGAPIRIPATRVVRFKPGKELREMFK